VPNAEPGIVTANDNRPCGQFQSAAYGTLEGLANQALLCQPEAQPTIGVPGLFREIMSDPITATDEEFMREALRLADEAEGRGEVPVGAVVVNAGRIAGRGYNSPISSRDPTAHAEILALREAARTLGDYRLSGATLYVTMEPCAMCAGALVAARILRLVFGVRDLRFGAVRSKFRVADSELLNHRVEVVEGVLPEECLRRLKTFFEQRR
jgi:tRNA(adenine34) deaminase